MIGNKFIPVASDFRWRRTVSDNTVGEEGVGHSGWLEAVVGNLRLYGANAGYYQKEDENKTDQDGGHISANLGLTIIANSQLVRFLGRADGS